MKTIIAGSRDIHEYGILLRAIQCIHWKPTVIVSGHAKGVDTLGEQYAEENNIPLEIYPADWKTHGKSAGPIRNIEMAKNSEALLAIWNEKSRGTKHMINTAYKHNLIVYVFKAF